MSASEISKLCIGKNCINGILNIGSFWPLQTSNSLPCPFANQVVNEASKQTNETQLGD